MKLELTPDVLSRLARALERAGRREIGGVLMGEHVGLDTFRVTEITVQLTGGTFAAFVRLVEGVIGPLRRFFHATNHEYARFNYIGEWHSHHSFALVPSDRDHATMLDLLAEPALGARFAVLLLVKLSHANTVDCSATVYRPASGPAAGTVNLVAGAARDTSQCGH